MRHLNHTVLVNTCRNESGVGDHTSRTHAQVLETFAHDADFHKITELVLRDNNPARGVPELKPKKRPERERGLPSCLMPIARPAALAAASGSSWSYVSALAKGSATYWKCAGRISKTAVLSSGKTRPAKSFGFQFCLNFKQH